MTDVPSDAAATTLAWSNVAARGVDARAFLQGQLSQDLEALGDEGAWSLLLEPDSVVIATLWVTPADEGYDLVVPAELGEVTLQRLRRFLLRAKCTLETSEATGPFRTSDDLIDANWPGAPEFAKHLTPHSFGRSFVASTISFQKGCFTGQELVGRLDARGSSVPWRFVRVAGAEPDELDRVLRSAGPEGPQGLTNASRREGSWRGVGIAHRTLLSSASLDNAPVTLEEIA